MTAAEAMPDDFPDMQTFVLPSRAYLKSFQEQTVPARRAALEDSRARFDSTPGEGHDAQLGLLSVIGDALQVVEDVGVMANALTTGYEGLSFYVMATVYESSHVNNFYSQLHRRDSDYFLRLAALRLGGRSIHEGLEFNPPLTADDDAAIAAAEDATARLLAHNLGHLAKAWETYRQFFHAYKHGALIANPEDVQLMRDRAEVVARTAVWRRHREQPEVGANFSLPLAELAEHATDVGELALDVANYIADTRSVVFTWMRFTDDGRIEHPGPIHTVPWNFWLRSGDIDEDVLAHLEGRFGIVFE
jgi:hypothetical protein